MWFVRFLTSSLGKKLIMATTGLLLFLFLCAHLAGNATIFMGSDVFQSYADELHSHPLIVLVFSTGLLVMLLAHMGFGLYLFFQNREKTYSRYAVYNRVVENSFASRTMPYTGLLILVFLIIHISSFTFAPEDVLISVTVKERLSSFFYSLFYIVSFAVLGIHLFHGFWSMLQTFGINHPRYNTLISRLTIIFPLFFFLAYGGIAFYFMTGLGSAF